MEHSEWLAGRGSAEPSLSVASRQILEAEGGLGDSHQVLAVWTIPGPDPERVGERRVVPCMLDVRTDARINQFRLYVDAQGD